MVFEADIIENSLLESHEKVFKELLVDHSTRKNIFWATDSYAGLGEGYQFHDEITIPKINGRQNINHNQQSLTERREGESNSQTSIPKSRVIVPRAIKSREEQDNRAKGMAEVFTPSWVCKEMIDFLDPTMADGHKARPCKTWHKYALATCLEITCGEAPFLVSRYDTVTGEPIPIDKRIGILDRKLRMVAANASDDEYSEWALLALGSVYGYEWQGDNLFLAREAVLATFADYYEQRFGKEPSEELLLQAAEIVSWNLWQMDGLKAVVPDSCHDEVKTVNDLFGGSSTTTTPCPGCAKDDITLHNGIRCRLRRWLPSDNVPSNCIVYTLNTKYPMKFDFVIGNPPYQEETKDTSDKPVYDRFMDGAYSVGSKVELITPARFLFNAGKTQKSWNEKMLADKHLKVLKYQQDSSKVFSNTDIKGGIAITYHDSMKDFGAIKVFSVFPELNSILDKVAPILNGQSLSDIFYMQNKFNLDVLYTDYPQYREIIGSGGRERRLTAAILYQLDIFKEQRTGNDDIAILGLINNKRVYRYIPRKYLDTKNNNLNYWKVLVPKSNGTGAIGEVISTPLIGEPLIGEPLIGYTQSFLGIDSFKTEPEAQAAYKYVCSKFARTMLGILKITQDNPPEKWKYVPLQDFTSSSDIDWTQSIHEIDLQLYKKYGLSKDETDFIERMVKPM